ncbi:MAG: DUF5996 family protein [Cetobacterium sp.]|uniref:DUF5996 family protein n=1 Tax=Cetobacterium sp. TaxID=2071632 RepID=UPI002FCA2E97
MMDNLKYSDWKPTVDTLGMYLQMAGKVMLERKPQEPEWEAVALRVTPTGLTTGPINSENGLFMIDYNFVDHKVIISDESGKKVEIPLEDGVSVAQFYKKFMAQLEFLGHRTDIYTIPQEWDFKTPFELDEEHKSYDKKSVEKWFEMVKFAYQELDKYAAPFRGKRSGIDFWWGTADMGTLRFSGKQYPLNPAFPVGFRYGVDAELVECGFSLGNNPIGEPYFYGFLFENSPEYKTWKIKPDKAYYNGYFIYLLKDVLEEKNPSESLQLFFNSVYEAATVVQKWEHVEELTKPLEMPPQKPHREHIAK